MNTKLLHLPPDELHHYAVNAAIHAEATIPWAELCIILGRIEDEGIWATYGYASARAWAEDELGVPPRDFVTLSQLWRTWQEIQHAVSLDSWGQLSKAKALLVRKVLALGADPKEWVDKANALSVAQLRLEVEKRLGKEAWVTFKVALPEELNQLAEAALVMALPAALPDEPSPDPEKTKDRAIRHRCFELILIQYVETAAVKD
jgi:hypothetical protein